MVKFVMNMVRRIKADLSSRGEGLPSSLTSDTMYETRLGDDASRNEIVNNLANLHVIGLKAPKIYPTTDRRALLGPRNPDDVSGQVDTLSDLNDIDIDFEM